MATKKISELTELAAAPADSDELEINDGGTSKKITVSNLLSNAGFSVVYKTADETINNDSTLSDDSDLQFSVDANSVYSIFYTMKITSGGAPDFKYAFTTPTGTTIMNGGVLVASTGQSYQELLSTTVTVISGSWPRSIGLLGVLETGGNAGTVVFQWAQNSTDPTNTTLHEGALIGWKKIS